MIRVSTLAVFGSAVFACALLTPQSADAQAVFLPVFRNFSYRGAVKVPDGGMTKMGGVTRSAEGRTSQGVPLLGNLPGAGRAFGNRGIGRENEAGNIAVKADIIIMEELEAKMLAEARANLGQKELVAAEVARQAAFLSKHVGRRSKYDSKNDR